MAVTQKRHPLYFSILHEIIMGSIVILVITGLYIHRPFVGGGGFLMSLMRGVHTFFAITLTISTVARVFGMFFGKNRDWRSFIPDGVDFKMLPRTFAYYAHVGKEAEKKKKYNPLQMISYCAVFVLILFQIFSGFAIKYPNNSAISWFNYSLFNNEIVSRMAHFAVTWLFILFVMIHVYLAVRENFSEVKDIHLLSESEESSEKVKVAKEPTGD